MKFIPVPLNEQIMIKMAILGIAVLFTNVISLILPVSLGSYHYGYFSSYSLLLCSLILH